MRTGLILSILILQTTTSAFAADVKFFTNSGDQTGVAPAMEAWHREEMKRQGGPGKSHGWWLWGLRAFDYDNDGVLDLLASHHGIPHSMLLRGEKTKEGLKFTDVTKSLGVDNRDLPGADDRPWVWDFDGDGWIDIAGFSDEAFPNCMFNQKGKTFVSTKGSLFKSLAHPREIIDLDGDGYLDLDAAHKGQYFYVPEKKAYRHDPKLRYETPKGVPDQVRADFETLKKTNRFFRYDFLTHDVVGYDTLGYHPRPIDLDNDGIPDVVVTGSGGYGAEYAGRYLLGQKDGGFVDKSAELGLPTAGAAIFVRDLTGDGAPEVLIVPNKEKTNGGLFLNDGHGKFTRVDGPVSQFLSVRGPYLTRAYQTDFDNDGQPDLVLSNPRLGSTGVYQNQGQGKFAEIMKVSNCWDSNPIAIADFDQDGRMDLAIGVRPKDTPGDINIYLNRTESPGHYLQVSPRTSAPNPFAVGTVVEVYRPGHLHQKGAQPIVIEKAHTDGTPVHAGLGGHKTCDIRVTFPNGQSAVQENVRVDQHITVKP